jgi:hypothetical protein
MRSISIPALLLSSLGVFGSAIPDVVVGRPPHSTVVKLTKTNFDELTKDDANGFWFLKFYAPW